MYEGFWILLVGLILGVGVAALLFVFRYGAQRGKNAEQAVLKERLAVGETQVAAYQKTIAEKERSIQELQEQIADLKFQIAGLTARRESDAQAMAEKLSLLERAESQLTHAFKALSAESLKQNNQAFLDLAQTTFHHFQHEAHNDLEQRQHSIEKLVQPLCASVEKVDARVHSLEKARVGAYASLNEQIKQLLQHQVDLRSETANLVQALRSPNVRGQWGELQLERVVEFAGMLEYCDFLQQPSTSSEEGTLRPDMIVRMPNGRRIVIDAKAPLDAYLDALQQKDTGIRKDLLGKHARHIRERISRLNSRNYWKQFEPSPEFVVLFLPGESFFSTALDQDPGLIEFGVSQRVLLATPTTLIALLKAVAYGWQQETLTLEAKKIRDLGRELYERVSILSGHFESLGKHLAKSVTAYNSTLRSLESRVLATTRKFSVIGSDPKKEVLSPQPLDVNVVAPLPASEEEQAQ